MKTLRIFLLISIAFTLSACGATKYAPMRHTSTGIETGYLEAQLDSTTWQVSFVANPSTGMAVVNRYMLYRAGELTTDRGFDYFVVLDYSNNSKGSGLNVQPGTSLISCPDPGTSNPYPKHPRIGFVEGTHSAEVTIRMMHGVCPFHNPHAYDARMTISMMGPSIARGD
ncbi:MAG: CC0125/CC1285 family lipoprotein [Candidatus Kapaibacterium sp.]